ncbi:hypothetical protein [Marinibactrum halimedae]|uniref:Uncharacterized protein n=1 Tax=Marinibactrum halimedae TaxID=1444977 RepID=A0AA37WM28_9GAMM|nr:hypothetical protein [Marinibactrum halimedae]MCD9459303.1 hypothetical protein [Marinibactrum halimedae]GLS25805.1 hypothetical protein GCM10007877_15190 [Marinibactrum halimedae]
MDTYLASSRNKCLDQIRHELALELEKIVEPSLSELLPEVTFIDDDISEQPDTSNQYIEQ